ncbi:MAG: Nif11-like leader peptide family RiPP precursor, partial [Christensenellales bacterium]
MNISKELLEKAKTAKSAEELLEIAKAENFELTEDEAVKAIVELYKTGEITDEELDNVSGGCGDSDTTGIRKFNVGDRVLIKESYPAVVLSYRMSRFNGKPLYLYDVRY